MTRPFDISGRSVLITGAASGIGRALAEKLLRGGNSVLAVDRDEERLKTLSGDGLHRVCLDLCDPDAVSTIVHAVTRPIDGLVNCAGVINLMPFRGIRKKSLREITENNYEAPVLLTAALTKKRKIEAGGSIVFVSSIMSVISTPTNALYTGTKAALAAVSRTLALELAPQKIRVNSVSPGFVETPMMDYIAQFTDVESNRRAHPLGFGQADDVANAIYFLLSDASTWITGSNIILDGGYCAK